MYHTPICMKAFDRRHQCQYYISANITSISFFGETNSCLLAVMAIILQEFPFAWFQIVLRAVFKAMNFPRFFK